MKRRRVKITGIGLVTPAGVGKESFQHGILEHRSHVSVVKRFPPEAGPFVAAEIKKFQIGLFLPDKNAGRLPRHTQFALAAAIMALKDARILAAEAQKLAPVIVAGASLMDSDLINRTIQSVLQKGPRFGRTKVIFHAPVAAIASAIAEYIGGGRALTLQSACCSGSDGIGHAAAMIAAGESDLAICGGTEAPIYYHPMLELKLAGLSPNTDERPEQLSRPFDLWRTTGVIGEGACMLVLEPENSPRPGYAYVSGYSFATEMPAQPWEGLIEAVRLCLANARLRPADVECINACGPGHKRNDPVEALALHTVFGSHLQGVPVASLKGAIGNALGACGAIQAGCAALGLADSFIPPTVNWLHPDPECALNLSSQPRHMPHKTTLVTAHGIGGANSCLLLSRMDA